MNNKMKRDSFMLPSVTGKKIGITGGAGFIGSNLARRLVEGGAIVTIFERPEKDFHLIQDIIDKIIIKKGDITKSNDIEDFVYEQEYLFHLAWQTDLKKSMVNPKEDISTDIIGLIVLLESCKKVNPAIKIIFSSTVTVIGLNNKINPDESVREAPLSIYEANKLCGEKYLKIYSQNYHLNTVILRLANVFGEGQRIDNPSRGIINFMIGKALRGEELTIYGKGEFIRDYNYVQNYIDTFLMALTLKEWDGEVYILGSGRGLSFNDAMSKLKSIVEDSYGKEVKVTHIPFPDEENPINKRNFISNFNKFKKATGWFPVISFEDGLKKTIIYYINELKNEYK